MTRKKGPAKIIIRRDAMHRVSTFLSVTDVTRRLHNPATFYQSHSAAAPCRQPNFETPKILVPNLGIGNAIALETPVSTEGFGSKPEFRAHFHSQTGVWERAVMRRCLRLSLGNALLRVTSVSKPEHCHAPHKRASQCRNRQVRRDFVRLLSEPLRPRCRFSSQRSFE